MNRSGWMMIAIASAASLLTGGVPAQPQVPGLAQPPVAAGAAPAAPAASLSLEQLAWLRGCWAGRVNRWDFIEQWSPVRGGMMVGVSHTTAQDKKHAAPARTQDFSYLRLEARADGIYYVAIPSGKKQSAFKFTSVGEDKGHTVYTFVNSADEFPQRIVYARGTEGWLYAQVAGKVGNEAKEITYPMRHVDCATGALIAD